MKFSINEKGQAVPNKTVKMTQESFDDKQKTSLYWLGNAGCMINCHGTIIILDPMIVGFDMPLLFESPLDIQDVTHVDGYLISHIDNDHCSLDTIESLKEKTQMIYTPKYISTMLKDKGYKSQMYNIGDTFDIGQVKVTLSEADHAWQNESKKHSALRHYDQEEYCGYWLDTPDGSIWYVGDSRLLESQLHRDEPDVMLFDFSDNEWHITLEGAVRLANQYPRSKLVLVHWGTVDAPTMTPFNGNPQDLYDRIQNPDRIVVLYPGEEYIVEKD